jgi:hypothetical protein
VFCTCADPTPLLAVTVNVYDPAVVGVPESTPAVVRVSPGGRDPAVTVVVGAGAPATWYVYGVYTVPTIPAGADPVIVDGTPTVNADDTADRVDPVVFVAVTWNT